MRALTPQLPSLSSPPSRRAGSPPRHPRPAPGTATTPLHLTPSPAPGAPGQEAVRQGRASASSGRSGTAPHPSPCLCPRRGANAKASVAGAPAAAAARSLMGTLAAPTREAADPAPKAAAAAVSRSWPRQPLPHSTRSCPSCGRLSACGTHSLCRRSCGPLLSPPLQVSSAQRFLAREILLKKKRKKKKMT